MIGSKLFMLHTVLALVCFLITQTMNNATLRVDQQSQGNVRQAIHTDDVTFLQWNCRSIATNFTFLTQHLHQTKTAFDVICLQSLFVKREDIPVISGYYYPPHWTMVGCVHQLT